MRIIITKLIFTLVLGLWINYRLLVDISQRIHGGWNTTIDGNHIQTLKYIGLILSILFFLSILNHLFKQINTKT